MPGAVGGAERGWGSGGVALLASHCHCASGLVGHAMTARMLWALWARRFKCAFPDGPTEPIPGWVRGCEVSEREACSLQLAVGARPPPSAPWVPAPRRLSRGGWHLLPAPQPSPGREAL